MNFNLKVLRVSNNPGLNFRLPRRLLVGKADSGPPGALEGSRGRSFDGPKMSHLSVGHVSIASYRRWAVLSGLLYGPNLVRLWMDDALSKFKYGEASGLPGIILARRGGRV
jgi:hypothetical protein